MKASLLKKLDQLSARVSTLSAHLSDGAVIANQSKFQSLSKEYAKLEPVVTIYKDYLAVVVEKSTNHELLSVEKDPLMHSLISDELKLLSTKIEALEQDLHVALLPKDPDDDRPAIVEVRAGTGGDEAALFAGDLFRMYTRFCERNRWRYTILNCHEAEVGGYKEVVFQIEADGAYGILKFESGAHRVQRVPNTEASGRIHTSACTVAVLPVAEDVAEVTLDPSEIRVDTFRSSGAGGQHVNTTDSAIRITHIPTGLVVECQDERSQHQNRARAMVLLRARIMQAEKEARMQSEKETRRQLVGTGDRSERIRTYNFPQRRVTDHRIGLTLHKLAELLEGDLNLVVVPLQQEHQADLMASLSEDRA